MKMNRVRSIKRIFFIKADLSQQTRSIAHLSKQAQILSNVLLSVLICILSINLDTLVLATLISIQQSHLRKSCRDEWKHL